MTAQLIDAESGSSVKRSSHWKAPLTTVHCSVPPVIRMPRQNRKCPVNLLGHHQPRQRVSQRHRPQRQQQLRPLARRLAPSARRPTANTICWRTLRRAGAQPCRKPLRTSSAAPGYPACTATAAVRPPSRSSHSSRASSLRKASVLALRKGRAPPQVNRNVSASISSFELGRAPT
jgi:hypothetical protein